METVVSNETYRVELQPKFLGVTNSAYEIHDISEKRYSGFLGLKPFTDANKQESFLYQLKLYGQIEFLVVSINMGVQY